MWSLFLLGLLAPRAALVVQPERRQEQVTVVLCPDADACGSAVMWLDQTGAFDPNVLLLDTILELERGNWSGGEALEHRFARALATARTEAAAGRWSMADQALAEAEQALVDWPGSPDNEALFSLYFLKAGLARSLAGDGNPAPHLAQAAAVAWNRRPALPEVDAGTVAAWTDFLASEARVRTGRLQVRSHPARPELVIDGVPVGPGPVEVSLRPGLHRVSATRSDTESGWSTQVEVLADQLTVTRPRFSLLDDPVVARLDLSAVFTSLSVRPEVAELLDEWCERYAIRSIRFVEIQDLPPVSELVRVQGGGLREVFSTPERRLRVVRYLPGQQRWIQLPVPPELEGLKGD